MTKPVKIVLVEEVRPEEPKENVYGEGTSGAFAEDLYRPRYPPPKEERKARNELAKLDLIPVPGIRRVTVRKENNLMYVIVNPDVYKNPTSDSYVVYGTSQLIDLDQQPKWQNVALANVLGGAPLVQGPSNVSKDPPPYTRPALKAPQEDEIVDYSTVKEIGVEVASGREGVSEPVANPPPPYEDRPMINVEQGGEINYMGVNENDVNVVCENACVSKQMAIDALLRNDNDVVNAIIALVERFEI